MAVALTPTNALSSTNTLINQINNTEQKLISEQNSLIIKINEKLEARAKILAERLKESEKVAKELDLDKDNKGSSSNSLPGLWNNIKANWEKVSKLFTNTNKKIKSVLEWIVKHLILIFVAIIIIITLFYVIPYVI